MTGRTPTRPRATVYRPFPDEMPVDLVGDDAPLDDVRVAKLDGSVVGAYRLARVADDRFAIVALAVRAAHRGVGIGRWLLGHAIGIAESRGGRTVEACGPAGFLVPMGFVASGARFRLDLTPE